MILQYLKGISIFYITLTGLVLAQTDAKCTLKINAIKEEADGFHIDYKISGKSEDYNDDYNGDYELIDDDGFVVSHLIMQEYLASPTDKKKYLSDKKGKETAISDEKRISFLKKSMEKFGPYYKKNIVDKAEKKLGKTPPPTPEEKLNLEALKSAAQLAIDKSNKIVESLGDKKLTIGEIKLLADFLEENIRVRDENNKLLIGRSYDVISDSGCSSWKYGIHNPKSMARCGPKWNPIGFPFNSINVKTAEVKMPEAPENETAVPTSCSS